MINKHLNRISPYIVTKNNFDLFRLLLASMVFLAHLYDLTLFKELYFLAFYLSASFAIKAFFVISGFLIFMSYEKSSTMTSYFAKRFFRIYPAYCFIVVLTTLSFSFISSISLFNYFSFDSLRYLFFNLLFLNFLEPALPGVFELNNINAVNGALWTLKIEVMFYASVPMFVYLFNRYNHFFIILTTYLISIFYSKAMLIIYNNTNIDIYLILARQLPAQLSYFMMGAFLYYFYNYLYPKYSIHLCVFAFIILISNNFNILLFLEPIGIGIIIITLSTSYYLGNYSKYGDFSYGVYIVHFPIIQYLYSLKIVNNYPFFFVILAIILVSLVSISIWHGIEKIYLRKKSRYLTIK